MQPRRNKNPLKHSGECRKALIVNSKDCTHKLSKLRNSIRCSLTTFSHTNEGFAEAVRLLFPDLMPTASQACDAAAASPEKLFAPTGFQRGRGDLDLFGKGMREVVMCPFPCRPPRWELSLLRFPFPSPLIAGRYAAKSALSDSPPTISTAQHGLPRPTSRSRVSWLSRAKACFLLPIYSSVMLPMQVLIASTSCCIASCCLFFISDRSLSMHAGHANP